MLRSYPISTLLNLFCSAGFLLMMGCTPVFFHTFASLEDPPSARLVGYASYPFLNRIDQDEAIALGKRNWDILSRYDLERPYRSGGDIPKRCLALSGGGMRSATYALGVLEALSEIGKLNELDIISSVSGGTYAAAWYFQHLPLVDGQSNQLFEDRFVSPILKTEADWFGTSLVFIFFSPISIAFSLLGVSEPGLTNLGFYYQKALLNRYISKDADYGNYPFTRQLCQVTPFASVHL